jgi:hypothetical protein
MQDNKRVQFEPETSKQHKAVQRKLTTAEIIQIEQNKKVQFENESK